MFKTCLALLMALLLFACNAGTQTTLDTARLGAAVVSFNASFNNTSAQVDAFRYAFTDEEWRVITQVRDDTQRVYVALARIVAVHNGAKGVVVDISDFLLALRDLRFCYKRAYTLLSHNLQRLAPELAQSLVQFNRSIMQLDFAYRQLVQPNQENTELIIHTLGLLGTGVQLIGA